MKSYSLLLVWASVSWAAMAETRSEVTPVQKVIQLLTGMREKGKQEKHAEQVQFAAYKQFCDDTSVQKQREIKEAEETIEGLKADIAQYTATAARLTKQISHHDADIAAWTGDKKAATKVRQLEKADYDALHADYSESVDALDRAIAVLKAQSHDRPQLALVQVSALQQLALIPPDARKALDVFLQTAEEPNFIAESAPEAHGYEFQSHSIIDMLNKLLDKFIDQRTSTEKQEMNSKHAYDMLMQDLVASIEQATQDRTEKAETKAKKLQAKADAKGELRETSETKEADEKYLATLTSTCEQKASDFESRQQLRAEEIEAISKAIDIISSEGVQGHAETYLPNFIQKANTALAQLRANGASSLPQQRVAQYLQGRAQDLHSRVLSALAVRVADDPFAKVKKMLKDLIVRLMEEANEEAEHKGWCDTELSTNEQTRKEKTQAVEVLHAEIDQLESSVAKLTEEITDLMQAVADLDAAMAKQTALRQEERKENAQTIQDAGEAQTAVAQALIVLKEFYEKAGDAVALVQRAGQQPVAPEIFDSPYQGMQSENGGVIGMLEVIESDFARLEADTKAAEASAQKAYDEFITESKVDKAAKTTDTEHKEARKQDETQALATKSSDLEGTQKELDAALAYFDKLKPSCVDAGVSYDSRVSRRKEEIESLQEALRILNGEDLS